MIKHPDLSASSSIHSDSNRPTRRGVMNILSASFGVVVGSHFSQGSPIRLSHSLPNTEAHTHLPEQLGLKLNPQDMIIHGHTPLTIEAKRHVIGTSVITHEKHLYIRNNLPMPSRQITHHPDQWRVEVTGVKQAKSLSVADLKTLGLHTVTAVLQCSGNGRAFYTHGPSGSQWSTGAAGCVIWSGVKVSDVVDYLGGLDGNPMYLTSTGADPLPKGIDPNKVIVERSIPLEKALQDALLAWEMNGDHISLEHGGPLRLIVPGYFGCNQIKYVKKLAFSHQQTQAKIQSSGYRLRPIGQKGGPEHPSMWSMPVKSWLTNEKYLFGRTHILRGVAMGGERPINKVEISLDRGQTWLSAPLIGPNLGPFAWRLFQKKVTLALGKHTIMSRAYDDQGLCQPETRYENERGYGHNAWRDHALDIIVSEKKQLEEITVPLNSSLLTNQNVSSLPKISTSSRTLSAQAQHGKQVYLKDTMPQCGVCHTLEDAQSQGQIGPNLNELKPSLEQIKKAVSNGIGAMPAQKQLSDQQLEDLAQYIFETTQK